MKQKRFAAAKRSPLNAVAIATTSLLLVTGLALAAPQGSRGNGPQGPGGFGGQGPGHGPFMGGVFRQLDLTEEQRTRGGFARRSKSTWTAGSES